MANNVNHHVIALTSYENFKKDFVNEETGEIDFNKVVPMPALVANSGDEYTDLGMPDWYNWSVANWGTKWNAYDCLVGDSGILMTTAWATPLPIWEKLAEKHDFLVAYADEDFGNNFGIIKADRGMLYIENFDDLTYVEKGFLSRLIFYGYDYALEPDEIDIDYVTEERRTELVKMVEDYLL